ncbi:MAG: GTPase HflX [Planctomycetes bacterium]|nr:GTPase HflX [Planctomycetota bacterium]
MVKVHGKTLGLKAAHVRAAERLYRRRVEPTRPLTHELARELSRLAADTRRCFGVVLDRGGRVQRVAIGDNHRVPYPGEPDPTIAPARLSGLRFVRTTFRDAPLSKPDLNLLARHRLDLVACVHGDQEGEPRNIRSAHLLPPSPQLGRVRETGPISPTALPSDFLELVASLEEEFRRAAGTTHASAQEERAILLGVAPPNESRRTRQRMAEMRELARTAGVTIVGSRLQRRTEIDPRTLVGRGLLEEIVHEAMELEANLILTDRELTPLQTRNLEEATRIAVLDRTLLILAIFERRAMTREAKSRVELARLRTLLPHLVGAGSAMSRQGGVGGGGRGAVRGAGEQKLEMDRRAIQRRIDRLSRDIDRIAIHRDEGRKRRLRSEVPLVALVGYTNAGKSTLFNALTDSGVRAEDRLFATLDTTTRRAVLPDGRKLLLVDTVGFIQDLPPQLVDAFRATLEELGNADLLLHLVDASDPAWAHHVATVRETLAHLDLDHLDERPVFNKRDAIDEVLFMPLYREQDGPLISARDPADVARLAEWLGAWL